VSVAGAAAGAAMLLGGESAAAATPYLAPCYVPVDPVRVYDSRFSGQGILGSGVIRRLVGGTLPQDIAQCFNLTVTQTQGAGYLAVFAGDKTWGGTSSINWTGPNQTLANNALSPVAIADGAINVLCGQGGSTHFILDLVATITLLDLNELNGVAAAGAAGTTAAGAAGTVGAAGVASAFRVLQGPPDSYLRREG
jgi:hypothetical protein